MVSNCGRTTLLDRRADTVGDQHPAKRPHPTAQHNLIYCLNKTRVICIQTSEATESRTHSGANQHKTVPEGLVQPICPPNAALHSCLAKQPVFKAANRLTTTQPNHRWSGCRHTSLKNSLATRTIISKRLPEHANEYSYRWFAPMWPQLQFYYEFYGEESPPRFVDIVQKRQKYVIVSAVQ